MRVEESVEHPPVVPVKNYPFEPYEVEAATGFLQKRSQIESEAVELDELDQQDEMDTEDLLAKSSLQEDPEEYKEWSAFGFDPVLFLVVFFS